MKLQIQRLYLLLIACIGVLFLSGCSRYAHNADLLYEPTTTVRGGSGELSIVIPENKQTQYSNVKWVLGKVTDNENNQIDNIYSSRSSAEILQTALTLELSRAGYKVIQDVKPTSTAVRAIHLSRIDIELDQISELVDIKAKCKVVVGMDVFKAGQLVKRLQYESKSSITDIKGRDMLAKSVLKDALQSVMLQAVPEVNTIFSKKEKQ